MKRHPLIEVILALGDFHRRMLGVYFTLLGPRRTYAAMSSLARLLYHQLDELRRRSESQCRAAIGHRYTPQQIKRIAEQSFVHRVLNIADLVLADRLIHKNIFERYGGKLPDQYLAPMLAAQRNRQPAILLTAYYGPFDLLPIFLGYNGIHAGVVYLPHTNPRFDAYRRRVREKSGCEMIPAATATTRIAELMEQGKTVAIVADHHAYDKGIPVEFFGLPTRAMKSVGLLAVNYKADVVVAGLQRTKEPFHFRFLVPDVIDHTEFADHPDPVRYITDRYLRSFEKLILTDPTQYIWAYPRWGREFAEALLAREKQS